MSDENADRELFSNLAKQTDCSKPNTDHETARMRARIEQIERDLRADESLRAERDAAIARAEKAEAEVERLTASEDAIHDKLAALSKCHNRYGDSVCACSYDRREDLCLYHSPQLVVMKERAEKAEAALEAARIEGCRLGLEAAYEASFNRFGWDAICNIEATDVYTAIRALDPAQIVKESWK